MPYHVRITKKSDVSTDFIELDLTRKQVIENIVTPYHNDKQFHCNGEVINPQEVKTIKINHTKTQSLLILHLIKEKREQTPIDMFGISDAEYIANEGKDVTREFIKHPPKSNKPPLINQNTPWIKIASIIIAILSLIATVVGIYSQGQNVINTQGNNNTNLIYDISGSNNQVTTGDTIIYESKTNTSNVNDTSSLTKDYSYKDIHISKGNSETLFNGKLVLGLINVNIEEQATINFNLNRNFQKVYVGDTTEFEVSGKKYILVISRVDFITDSIEFSIYSN